MGIARVVEAIAWMKCVGLTPHSAIRVLHSGKEEG